MASTIHKDLSFDELFHLLRARFELPLPPEKLTKGAINDEFYDYFVNVKFLWTHGKRNLVAAIEEFEKFYNIDGLPGRTVSKAESVRSSQQRQAKLQERRVKAFNHELKKQIKLFERNGGSIVTQGASRMASLNDARRIPSHDIGSRSFAPSSRNIEKVLAWQRTVQGSEHSKRAGPEIDKALSNMDLGEEGLTDFDIEMDHDDEINGAFPSYAEESTEIDDSGLVSAANFDIINIIAAVDDQFGHIGSTKGKSSCKPVTKSAVIPGAFPESSSEKSNRRPSATTSLKSSTNPASNSVITTPPSKKVGRNNHNWGVYNPPDISPPPPPPSRLKLRSSQRLSRSLIEMEDEKKRKRRSPVRQAQAAPDTQNFNERAHKRQSPNRIETAPPKSSISRGLEFKIPGLPRSLTKENHPALTSSAPPSQFKAYPKLPDMQTEESFSTEATSRRTSFAFDEPHPTATQPTSFNSTMPGKTFESFTAADKLMADENEDDGRFEDVSDSLIPPVHLEPANEISEWKGKREGSTVTDTSMRSRSIIQPRASFNSALFSDQTSPAAQLWRESSDRVSNSRGTFSIGTSTERGMAALDIQTNGFMPTVEEPPATRPPSIPDQIEESYERSYLPKYSTVFGDGIRFQESAPFWFRYEVTRYVLGTNAKQELQAVNGKVGRLFEKLSVTPALTYDQTVEEFRKAFGEYKSDENYTVGRLPQNVFQKIQDSLAKWDPRLRLIAEVKFQTTRERREPKSGVFPIVRLQSIDVQSLSNRFSRKFGSDRFMILKVPVWNKNLGIKETDYWDVIKSQYMDDGIQILNRKWRAVYFQEASSNDKGGKKRKKEKVEKKTLIMFAEQGDGLDTIDRRDAIEWLIPCKPNEEQTGCKFFSRIKLGFTPTIPTVVFDQEKVRFVEDDMVGKEVLTDGCGLVSPAVMRAVKKYLDLDYLPGAVQARIGPAKGLWFADPEADVDSDDLWIQIRISQKKFEGINLKDPAHRTLDVVKVSKTVYSSSLNLQFLPILLHNGVPRQVLDDLTREDIKRELGEVLERLNEPIFIKGFVENLKLNSTRKSTNSIARSGSLPSEFSERITLLLDAGFDLESSITLRDWFKTLLRDYCEDIQNRMHITVPKSRTVWCVADPTGTLKRDEVYLRFSEPVVDELTFQDMDILLGDVIVGRNPAHVVSDMRKVTAIDVPQLRHLKDVIVFSADKKTCERSLASYLSGGDYDGDVVLVTWEPRLTQYFKNQEIEIVPVDCHFKKDISTMKEALQSKPGLSSHTSFDSFLNKHLCRGLEDDILGMCTSLWERIVYNKGINDEFSKELAALCNMLVDAPKQGDNIRPGYWEQRQKEVRKPRYSDPLYKEKEITCTVLRKGQKSKNDIDILKFQVAYKEAERLMLSFDKKFSNASAHDEDISNFYDDVRDWFQYMKDSSKSKSTPTESKQHEAACGVLGQINRLNQRLHDIKDRWYGYFDPGGENVDATESGRNRNEIFVDQLHSAYRGLMPTLDDPDIFPSQIAEYWATRGTDIHSEWSLLRAAALFKYDKHKFKTMSWKMAADELCYIKLRAVSTRRSASSRLLTESMYLSTKVRKSAMAKNSENGAWMLEEMEKDDLDSMGEI